ncbi:MAG: cysteine desulfurase, partial [Methanothrix sp.]|nr:cysteine desulfurase [Methanothrix sp.]
MCGIYLDHQSCCPVDPRVEEFARRYSCIDFGNPSALHSRGLAAKAAVEEARGKVAELIGAENPECIIFTAGATQANNLAIRGAALRNAAKGKKLLASQIEHISVLNPHKDLKKGGFEMDTIPVDGMGVIDVSSLERLAGKETVLASVMYANGEIGTVQPIKEVSEIVHREGTLLHVDATAAAGKIAVDVQKDGIDLLTLSSNDIYGPQGAGALYVRPGVRIQPVIFGGGQERGLSPGTENLYALAGFGEAARLARLEMAEESRRLL